MEIIQNHKRLYPTAIVLYLNYLVLGVAASILGQYKQEFAAQWGAATLANGAFDASGVVWVSASLGLGCLIGSFVSGPLSDKIGRRIVSAVGSICYAVFFLGMVFSTNLQAAYVFGLIGGIANAFSNGGVMPAVMEIFVGKTAVASILTKLFVAIGQFILPLLILFVASNHMPYTTLFYVFPVLCAVLTILTFVMPFPAMTAADKSSKDQPSFWQEIKAIHFTPSSIALIIMGFTTTATFQIWVNCNQEFGRWVGMENPTIIQSYYSVGIVAAVLLTAAVVDKYIKSIRLLLLYPAIALTMLIVLLFVHHPLIAIIGGFVLGYSAAGGVLQLVTAVVSDLFPHLKGTIISVVMVMSSIGTWVGVSAAGSIASMGGNNGPEYVILFNSAVTLMSVLLALFVNISSKRHA